MTNEVAPLADLGRMRVRGVDLVRVELPLVTPIRTALGVIAARDALLVRVRGTGGQEGWGECAAEAAPGYWHEWTAGCEEVLRRFLVPQLEGAEVGAGDVPSVRGWPMASAAVQCAVLDALCRRAGVALATWLGGRRSHVDATLTVGIGDDRAVGPYRFVKRKAAPGRVPVIGADDPPTVLDANGSFTARTVDELLAAGAWYVEQPLPADDLVGHAALGTAATIALDESIRSAGDVRTAAALGACRIVVLKPGRLGGLLATRAAHDAAVTAGLQAKVGGMWDTAIGRAAALAVASLPGCSLPADLSGSDRYFDRDVVAEPPTVDAEGRLRVPAGPGLGIDVVL